ncbi:MAG: bacillithiol biosynthesis deacetylase BshB1 [Sediminibacterium sp.]|nr:bacillithiol biosynthesis deacetylase BshB1 [Sediminibacterium sp.]
MKLHILAIGAHPDDVELGCGGFLLSEISQGKSVGILDLTEGELGSRGTKITRQKEATAAAKLMGIKVRDNCQIKDGFIFNNEKNVLTVAKYIRLYQPEIVLTTSPKDRHPDHHKTCDLVQDACFLSNLIKINISHKQKKLPHWKPAYVFNYIQDLYIEPHFLIDISHVFNKKMAAIKCYSSQFYNPQSKDVDTYLSQPGFLENIEHRARLFGKRIGVSYAEGFLSTKTLGLSNLNSLINNKT